jgi:hypothetical protein
MNYKQGVFQPKNPEKYKGNVDHIIFRSGWELACFKWLDKNKDVTEWSSEEVVIAYVYEVDQKFHRYFVDLKFIMKGKTYIIEIKPKKETVPPVQGARKTRRYITEGLTYVKNQNKWEAAEKYAKKRGWIFQVWTEETLQKLHILPKPIGKVPGKMKKLKPLRKPKKRAK